MFSSYAKILGETNFHTCEFPRSGSTAKDGEEKRERGKVGNKNGQLHIATPPWVAHAKPSGPTNWPELGSTLGLKDLSKFKVICKRFWFLNVSYIFLKAYTCHKTKVKLFTKFCFHQHRHTVTH